jgi:hypothetical protein
LIALIFKFIVGERVVLGSDEAFWGKYSNSEGTRLGYQQILDSLKLQRQVNNESHAADARTFFRGDLGCAEAGGAFSYLKDSVPAVSAKDDVVAKHWKALLAHDKSVADKWSAMQELV